ncbi:MAG: MCE family protein [Nitrospiraceae bacterium]|nr:MAG: MCE family protein [Nitrospiraceae bacterium]
MKSASTELKVGLFAIIVIMVLSYMTFKVGRMPFLWEKGYRLYVEFSDINGLDEKSRIKVAGVDVGIVDKITLKEGRARLTLLINPEVKIYRNAKAFLKMSGLLGDRYLALSAGTPDEPVLRSGETITTVIPAADIDMLANKLTTAAAHISELSENLKNVFGEKEKRSLSEAIDNLKLLAQNLKEISEENREPLRKVLAQLDRFTEELADKGPGVVDDMSRAAKSFEDKVPKLLDDLSALSKDLREVVGENRYALKESVENIRTVSKSATNIAQKIESGEGTLGKLMKDSKLYDSLSKVSEQAGKTLDVVGGLRTFLDFHSEYNTGESEWKGYFDLTLQPRKDKYYILGVVTDPMGSVEETDRTINGVTTVEEEIKHKIEFSAQYARRFEDLALRIGLTENTFGMGADYFFQKDKGRIKLDVWDFSGKEAEADKAHARIGVDYSLFKFVFLSAGIDNILNPDRRGIYLGGGLKFEDDDFKYLFGKAPSLSLP